jgi:1-acyl-sn-glycerol-3-phosphate acyltransferase
MNRGLRFFSWTLMHYFPYGQRIFDMGAGRIADGPAVVVANHQSSVDITAVLAALPCELRMVAKTWVWEAPLMGRTLRAAGYLHASGQDAEGLFRQCEEILRRGSCVFFFPEGTRSESGDIRRFHRGAFDVAERVGVDFVPVVLCDSRAALPKSCFWIGDHRMVVKALPRAKADGRGSRQWAADTRKVMQEEYERCLETTCQGRHFRRRLLGLYRYRGPFVERYLACKTLFDTGYERLGKFLPRQGQILDLGCGYGHVACALAWQGPRREVLGVDYDEDKIAIATRVALAFPRLKFQREDLLDWTPPPADGVLLTDVLHYWSPGRQDEILRRAWSCLRPGGRLVMRDACADRSATHQGVRWIERWARWVGHNRGGAHHYRTLDEYVAALRALGCAEVQVLREPGLGANHLFVGEKSHA